MSITSSFSTTSEYQINVTSRLAKKNALWAGIAYPRLENSDACLAPFYFPALSLVVFLDPFPNTSHGRLVD